ncbi:hypothetical protein SAMN06298216_0701 [Spirosomataceae bacterium TFI 002]|nr:hypothetical protein SAMN06298216_0701 [Spirosomataceae bacterium TFI 002]
MKRLLILLTIMLSSLAFSCKELGSEEVEPKGDTLLKKTIGKTGGAIVSEKITLEVPSGAFDTDSEIEILVIKNNPQEINAVLSGYYAIDGLPLNLKKPLKIKIKKTESSIAAIPLIAIGNESFSSTLNKSILAHTYLDAVDSSDYIIATMPVTDDILTDEQLNNARVHATKAKMYLISFDGNFSINTPDGHFQIYFPYLGLRDDVEKLGSYLENAFTKFKGLGFSTSKRTKWPVKVLVKSYDSSIFGFEVNSIWGDNYSWLEFNTQNIDNAAEMKLTAGHEYFHLLQSLYDPRTRFSKAKGLFYTHFWLDEATAVWSEKLFTNESNYASPIRNGHQMAPFNGMQKGAEENQQYHGYGMSAMIQYLTNTNSDTYVKSIYDGIKSGKHPVDAVSIKTPFLWWDKFMKDYFMSEVYKDVDLARWLQDNHGSFNVSEEKDSVKVFDLSYPDFSAKIFRINLKYDKFVNEANMEFQLPSNSDSRLQLFKTKGSSLSYVGSTAEKYTLKSLKTLKDDGSIIFALVTNTQAKSPYLGDNKIPLRVRINNLVLDENLFGKWVFEDGSYWQFNPDGTCIQHINGVSYDWLWMIENGQLKLYIPNGKPAFKTYKIEGNKLYFWVEQVKTWSLPYTKR